MYDSSNWYLTKALFKNLRKNKNCPTPFDILFENYTFLTLKYAQNN